MQKNVSSQTQHNSGSGLRKLRFPRFFLTFVLILCALTLFCSAASASTAHSVDEAISWCYSMIGQSIDTDGYPSGQPYQCVDLIRAYYQYLGVSPVSGNGADYAWNDLPSGWTRVQGGTPQRGDILVYGASNDNPYGHVAIFEDTRSTFHQNVEGYYVKRLTYAYNGFSNPYWGYIRPDFTSSGYLDVNGLLDGEYRGQLSGFGTCDVYINGSRVADDVSDYYISWPVGTAYSITDIKAADGFEYEGVASGSLSGTITASGADIRLSFLSHASLVVAGRLDGVDSADIEGFGTFDVYINGALSASGVSSYDKKWPQGTAYEISNVQVLEGKYFNSAASGVLSGTLGKEGATVNLSFSTILEADADWIEADELPDYIDPLSVEIQYKNYYHKTSTDSPGDGWTQVPGSGVTTYENSGGVYDSDFALATSDTRIHVGTYYYHYCYSGCGDVEHYNDGLHTVYHNVGDINLYYTDWEGADSSDSRYTAYRIKWASGEWANGYAYCSLGSPAVYYRRYQYQDRVAITNYKWISESDWCSEMDDSASSVKVRFRLKQYSVNFDASGGINAPEALVKHHGVDLELPIIIPEMPAFSFLGWNTQADGTGTMYAAGSLYSENADVTLFAQWEPLSKVVLPASVKTIDDYAFENTNAIIVEVPEGCKKIGAGAFRNCTGLQQLYLPASVDNIAFDAFDGCDKLTIFAPENSPAIRFANALGIPCMITD